MYYSQEGKGGFMRRFLAVSLALSLGFAQVAYAADLEPVVTKAPVYKAPEEVPIEAVGFGLVLIPIVVCVELCFQHETHPPPISGPPH